MICYIASTVKLGTLEYNFEIKMYHEFMSIYDQKLMNFNAFYLFIKFDIE